MTRPGFVVDVDACFACGACVTACRVATDGDARIRILQLESAEEARPFWIPYVCTQVGDPACSFEGRPPCARTCPSGALIYGDLDDPSSPPGAIVAGGGERGAEPLPTRLPEPRAYRVGRVPGDVERSLPDPASVIPGRRIRVVP
jgi:Fe-S-cluster-containing dehydrogenase component